MPVMEALPLRANPPAALLDLSTAHLDTLHTLGSIKRPNMDFLIHGHIDRTERHHQIPPDQGERGGVAEVHRLFLLQARVVCGNTLCSRLRRARSRFR